MNFQKSIICLIASLIGTAVVYELNEIARYFALRASGECLNGIGSYVNAVALICCLASIAISGFFVIKCLVRDQNANSKKLKEEQAQAAEEAKKAKKALDTAPPVQTYTEVMEEAKVEESEEAVEKAFDVDADSNIVAVISDQAKPIEVNAFEQQEDKEDK